MMAFLSYIIALPFLYFIAILPFPLLYLFSDGLYFLIYKIFGYRKQVVRNNLKNSFPNKSENELIAIEKKFYQFFCDLMVETIKTLTITKKQAKERCKFNNLEVFEKYYQQNQHIILVLGHYGNWELAGAGMNAQSAYQLYVIYKPLANKYFNRLIIKMRTRLGNRLIPMKETFRQMLVINKDKKPSAVAFIADQTPAPENAYWTTFLNQETPVFWGTELIARKLNFPIIYTSIKRVKRGYYEIDLEVLEAHPKNTKEGEISEKHTKRLEKDIINYPEIWLWTHRRWKHKKPSNLK